MFFSRILGEWEIFSPIAVKTKTEQNKKWKGKGISMKRLFQWMGVATIGVLSVMPAWAQRPYGMDVYAGNGTVNWTQASSDGIQFGWAKATQGTYYEDANYSANMQNAKSAGIVIGAYCFADPSNATAAVEADYFWNYAKSQLKADGKSLMPVLDYETWDSPIKGASSYADWANQWCDEVVKDAAASGVRVTPIIYISADSTSHLSSENAWTIPWIAAYNGDNPQTGSPWDLSSGANEIWGSGVWDAWQYNTETLVGMGSGKWDVDTYNGNYATMISDLGAQNMHICPCVATNSDGRIELFAVGNTGYLYHKYQTNNDSGFSSWVALSTNNLWSVNCQPAVHLNSVGQMELFIPGTDGQINHTWEQTAGNSTSWTSFGVISGVKVGQTCKLATGLDQNGGSYVYAVSTNGPLYESYQSAPGSAWSAWTSLGGNWDPDSDLAALTAADGTQELLMIGYTGELYENHQSAPNGGFSGWTATTTNQWATTARIAATLDQVNKVNVFVVGPGPNSPLYHTWQTGTNSSSSWNNWVNRGGSWEQDARPAAIRNQNGDPAVFLIGTTGNMYVNQGPSWTSWGNIGGTFAPNAQTVTSVNQNAYLDVFAVSTSAAMDYAIQHTLNTTNFNAFQSLGGTWQ
jgi:GH25 family lysozyme M1 (1,4-beta-N-acetylmuramidase)